MLLQVIDKLGLRANETDKYIVDRLRDSLQILKRCDGEQQRLEYRLVLKVVAPVKVKHRCIKGWGTCYGDRLKVETYHCCAQCRLANIGTIAVILH